MAVVQNTYTGNGSTVLYSLSFSYLDQTDVKVSVNGTIVTNYIFATASSIQFLTAPGAGTAIRIYRETDIDQASATIFPGSAIKAQDLNDNFTQTLYAVQESNFEADSATTTANTALTTANTAISTANAATSTANTALSNSATAVSTANTASTNASNAVTTANTASSNASAAVTTANAATVTANSASSTAATALSTANTASSNASAAVSTANTASTNASNAVTTANTALSTANTASSNASTAVTTANNAVSTANGAVSTANTALTTANAAISAVASAVIYTPVANLTALAALTPSNGDYFELTDSTGAEGSALITGVTVGLVGAPGLTFRLRYDAPPGIFTFLGYFANDSETRYLKFSGGTLTGQLRGDDSTSASTPGFAFDGDANTGIGRPGADELALITGGTARLTIDSAGAIAVAGSLSQGGNAVVVTTDSRLSDTRVPTDGSVTNAKVAAAAAIDGTKISPDFGSQNVTTTGAVTGASLSPTSSSVPTNGVYLPAANSVAVATNGTGRLFITDTRLRLNVSSQFHISNNTDASSGLQFIGSDSAESTIGTMGNHALTFRTNSVERMRLTSTGLGIGSTAPQARLHIVGGSASSIYATTDCFLDAENGLFFSGLSTYNTGIYSRSNSLVFNSGTTGTETARFDSSKRFLVGTSSGDTGGVIVRKYEYQATNYMRPLGYYGVDLGMVDNTNTRVWAAITSQYNQGSAVSAGLFLSASHADTGGSACGYTTKHNKSDHSLAFSYVTTGASVGSPAVETERMRINSAGNLSVGTSTSTGTFITAPTIGLWNGGSNNSIQWFGSSPTPSMRFTAWWDVGNNLYITDSDYSHGVALAQNSNAWGSFSDARLKQDIACLSDAINLVKAINPCRFKWKSGLQDDVGFIAQELKPVLPEAVDGEESDFREGEDGRIYGPMTVKYEKLIPVLTAALQEAITKIETLEAKVAALEAA
jgi:hypothetical protein